MISNAIFHDLFIKASSDKVFEAISMPDYLENWWPLRCSGEPTLNAIYNYYFTPEYNWFGKVIQVEMNKILVIEMKESDEDWEGTKLSFNLEELEGGINLRFSHTGWPQCNHHFRRSSYCWAILLYNLKKYVETGQIVPFEERE